jgi:hypothetical protein
LTADRQVRYARILGLVFCVAGGAAIAIGWNGAARLASPDQQLPYILSGGFGGMALVLLGVALLLIAQIRTERRKLMNVLEEIAVAVGRTASERGDALVERRDEAFSDSAEDESGARAEERAGV